MNIELSYEEQYKLSINKETLEQYWREQAEAISWYKQPEKIVTKQNEYFYRWFEDGIMNTCYNCLDRHIPELGDHPALYYDSPITNKKIKYTYTELLEQVSKLAGVLVDMGIQKSDRVIIYMPMIPQAVFAMLACARIGAIHSVVFGGFAAKELSSRILDTQPKLIITASCGIEPPNKIIQFKKNIDLALSLINDNSIKVLLFQRQEYIVPISQEERYYDFDQMMAKASPVPCVELQSTDPLYILYTSGTTGTPKGIIRDNGGNAVAIYQTMKYTFNTHKKDVYFSTSDIGWVVGHSFIVYGPLLVGASTILFEGKPTLPDPGTYWRIIEEYQVKSLQTSPTALRVLKREDQKGDYILKYNIKSLDNVALGGERADIPSLQWLRSILPERILVNDTFGQTETGRPICSNYAYPTRLPEKFGSCKRPGPGYIVHILNNNNEIVSPNKLGKVCVKLPLPPSGLLTIYNHDEGYVNKYLQESPGYQTTGDAGYIDEDGDIHIMGRIDDVINTAGHRLSTGLMEEILNSHNSIAESAVVSLKDELRGEIPIGFAIPKRNTTLSNDQLEAELIEKMRQEIGPVAVFKKCFIVDRLPKTRSGKIIRCILRKILNGEIYRVPGTIEDETVLSEIYDIVKLAGLGTKINIVFEEDLEISKPIY